MIRFCTIATLALLQMACSTPIDIHSLVGHYQNVEYSRLEIFLNGLNGRAVTAGTELTLNSDSTYEMMTCANILTGTWTVESDTLKLQALTNRWRIDSLQTHGFNGTWPKVRESTMDFVIDDNHLVNEQQVQSSRRIVKIKLKKINEP